MSLKMFKTPEKAQVSKIKYVIAVAAGKGGVGKSTIAVNLALALKQIGYSVGIMDADIYGPSIRKMLPEDRFPQQKGDVIIPALCHGIRMISMAYFRKEHEAAAIRAPIANGIVTQFLKQVEWGNLDFLIIDFPPGTGDVQLTMSQQANLNGALMVSTPQEVAILDVRKAMNLFEQVKVPVIGVVENMSYFHHEKTGDILHLFGKGGGERLARESGVPFLGSIPIDPAICESGDKGTSLFEQKEGSPSHAAKAFLALAETFVSHLTAMEQEREACLEHFELIWKEM